MLSLIVIELLFWEKANFQQKKIETCLVIKIYFRFSSTTKTCKLGPVSIEKNNLIFLI